jgi:hypothetical protein
MHPRADLEEIRCGFAINISANAGETMTKKLSHTAWIENGLGDRLKVELQNEGGELLGRLLIDKIPYHVFFATQDEISRGGERFVVDRDPDYQPKPSPSGRYLLIAPYCK